MRIHCSVLFLLQMINKMGGEDLPDLEGVDDEVCMSIELFVLYYHFLVFLLHKSNFDSYLDTPLFQKPPGDCWCGHALTFKLSCWLALLFCSAWTILLKWKVIVHWLEWLFGLLWCRTALSFFFLIAMSDYLLNLIPNERKCLFSKKKTFFNVVPL